MRETDESSQIAKSVMDLCIGEEAFVEGFAERSIACQLLTIGIVPDLPIILLRKAPFGGAVCLKLGDTVVAVRTHEAKTILVK